MAIDSEVSLKGGNGGIRSNVDNGGNIDHLFIANSDSPTASLVTSVFSRNNFLRWK